MPLIHGYVRSAALSLALLGSVNAFAFGGKPVHPTPSPTPSTAPDYNAALCTAVQSGDLAAATQAIADGAVVAKAQCATYDVTLSPLWLALLNDQTCASDNIIKLLVGNGANLEEVSTVNGDYQAATPLGYALQHQQLELASTLLTLGANPNPNTCASTCQVVDPYAVAIVQVGNQAALDLFMSLVDHGMQLRGLPINQLPAQDPAFWLVAANALVAKFPNQQLFDLNLAYAFNQENASADMVSWAVQHGLNYSSTQQGQTVSAYQDALQRSTLAYVQAVITSSHAVVSGNDVFVAVNNQNTGVFDYVVQNAQDLSALDSQGQTLLMDALLGGYQFSTIQEILAKKQDFNAERATAPATALEIAAYQGDVNTLNAVLAAGADPSHVSKLSTTALMQAVTADKVANVMVLLKASAADVNQGDASGNTAAMMAVNDPAVLDAVASAQGFAVNAQNNSGKTALMLAVESRNTASVVVLLNHGACVKVEDTTGHTALGTANDDGLTDIETLLNLTLQQAGHC